MNVSMLTSLLLFVKNYLSLVNAERRILIQSVTFTSRYRQRGRRMSRFRKCEYVDVLHRDFSN